MRSAFSLNTFTGLAFSLLIGCTLSNRVEDMKVLCGVDQVNLSMNYVRVLNGSGMTPSTAEQAALSAEFIHSDGRVEALSPTRNACVILPRVEGHVSVRVAAEKEWVAILRQDRESPAFRAVTLEERATINAQLACPEQGFIAHDALANAITVKDRSPNLQNLQIALTVLDREGRDLGSIMRKDFGEKQWDLPTQISVAALDEGTYSLQLTVRDSFFGQNPKALLVQNQCPLQVKHSCSSASDIFDPETVTCKPKLCEGKFRVGEFWSDELANTHGQGLFTCQLDRGEPVKVAKDATCKAGYFETHGDCVGAKQVAAGQNHTCALLETDEVSCWGYNVFGILGASEDSGQVLAPQAPVGLLEPVKQVAVGMVSSCALLQSGRVQCWGAVPVGLDDQGLVAFAVKDTPQLVKNADGTDLSDVSTLIVGGGPDHDAYCVLKPDQKALCWGKDLFSRNGTIQYGNWLYPHPVFESEKVQALDISEREICIVNDAGKVFCQGSALVKDLAVDAPAEPILVPLPAPARTISSRSVGKCSILRNDEIYCWDQAVRTEWSELRGFLGVPDIRRIMTAPITNPDIRGFELYETNSQYLCVLDKNHRPLCRPGPSYHILGDIRDYLPIEQKDGSSIDFLKTFSTGFWHGCGVHASGQVSCWGDGQFGRLGDGSFGESSDGRGIPHYVRSTLIQAP